MTLTLTFLGTGAAIPSLDRNVASLAVAREGETLLFDCGEGTQRQMMRYGVSFSVRDLFFTHFQVLTDQFEHVPHRRLEAGLRGGLGPGQSRNGHAALRMKLGSSQ